VNRIRVLLADRNSDFLEGLAVWLSEAPGFEVVAKVRSGREAVELVERLEPELVLMDTAMVDMNGFDAARKIKARHDAPLVLLMTLHPSQTALQEAWSAGADGLVSKIEITDELVPLVRELTRGKRGTMPAALSSPAGTKSKSSLFTQQGPPRGMTDRSRG
jgi:DNA-binding NarL/FixJ family response regulator